MTEEIRALEEELNGGLPQYHQSPMDLSGWDYEQLSDYREWLREQCNEMDFYMNISAEAAWDLA